MNQTSRELYLQSQERQDAVLRQKKIFMEGGTADPAIISEYILHSWQRSRNFAINPNQGIRPCLGDEEFQIVLRENAELLEVAREILDKMFSPILEAVSALSLCSAEGVTLYISNRPAHKDHYPDARPGAVNREEFRGTNGIGTCIAEKRPIEIIGAEHFCTIGHRWSCSTAPIFNHNNQLVGILNVTQPREMYHSHTLGMVQAAVCAISEQLRLRSLLKRQKTILELLDEGVVVLDNDSVEIINRKAMDMLNLESNPSGKNFFSYVNNSDVLSSILKDGTHIIDREAVIPLQSGNLHTVLSLVPTGEENGIVLILREARRMRRLAAQMSGARATYTFDQIVGQSRSLRKTIEQAKMVAENSTTVLLLGESGTGKELFAQSIHNASPRASRPFVVVNCGALPRNLVESELFGYEDGAFTGASKNGRPGKFELADGGTIFLDEIGEMPLDAQVSLLRLLQNGEVTRVGGKFSRKVSVRVIAATNRNLEEAIRQHTFREDLFYRLHVFPIYLPPLRERDGDVLLLAQYFLKKFTRSQNKEVEEFTPEVASSLQSYSWPGNIRELENMVERMVNMTTGAFIGPESLPAALQKADLSFSPSGILESREFNSIMEVLKKTDGNMRAAAEILGLSRGGLYVKLKRLGIDYNQYRKK